MTFVARTFAGTAGWEETKKMMVVVKAPANKPKNGQDREYKIVREIDVPDNVGDVGIFVAPQINEGEYWVYADDKSVRRG